MTDEALQTTRPREPSNTHGINTHDKLITQSSEHVRHTQTLSDRYRREAHRGERELNKRSGGDITHPNVCH